MMTDYDDDTNRSEGRFFSQVRVIKKIDSPLQLLVIDKVFEKIADNNVIISSALHLKEVFQSWDLYPI
jgi:hypothetical protein